MAAALHMTSKLIAVALIAAMLFTIVVIATFAITAIGTPVRVALARAVLLAFLTVGAMCGVPMDPAKIENLMQLMTRTKIVRVVKKDDS